MMSSEAFQDEECPPFPPVLSLCEVEMKASFGQKL